MVVSWAPGAVRCGGRPGSSNGAVFTKFHLRIAYPSRVDMVCSGLDSVLFLSPLAVYLLERASAARMVTFDLHPGIRGDC